MNNKTKSIMPHIGMRKFKSILSVFIGLLVWQGIRFFFPGLEVHPIYIYIYGMIEIRDSSEKTVDFGKKRIKATFIALGIGLPILFLNSYLQSLISNALLSVVVEVAILLIGILIAITLAELAQCKTFCGIAAVIFIILFVAHSEDGSLTYSILRAFQTILGVFIAWIVNVKLFPYPNKSEN
ncbi:MAG: hypothetical protein II234_02345 [Clostridia bacterium]|nr:hypothetical protein [Clostridia bacterium]